MNRTAQFEAYARQQDRLIPNGFNQSTTAPIDVTGSFWTFETEHEREAAYSRDPWLLEGLLRQREVMNLVADSKAYKSFTVMDLAVCQAFGREFMGRYRGTGGKVLILDNELKPNSFRHRGEIVARSHGLVPESFEGQIVPKCFRHSDGELPDVYEIGRALAGLPAGEFSLVIIDSLYRCWPEGMSENDNNSITKVYNSITNYSRILDTSFLLTVHTSSGSQSGKKHTDIGVGGKAMSRAADVHATILQHETDGYAVFQASVRDDVSIPPQSIFMNFPRWQSSDIDPNVKRQKSATEEQRKQEDSRILESISKSFDEPFTRYQFKEEFGVGSDRASKLIRQALQDGLIVKAGKSKRKAQQYKPTDGRGTDAERTDVKQTVNAQDDI